MPAVQPAEPAPAPAMQRRHSSASSDAGSDHSLPLSNSRHTSQENVSLIPTRTAKVSTSKPPANPLQFVKVGPCDLSRYAQEQLKKAEQVKKAKPSEKQDEAADWQSNLDNWKVSRRKRQEHIIERVVEVKKLELEEHDRNRRRSKTFSEMLEDRNMKGRKTSLPVYQDDNNDLSDLGLSTSHKTNGEDSVFHEEKDGTPSSNDVPNTSSSAVNGQNGHSHMEPSSEQEEYTYERAIQNYINFTESRNIGRSLTPSEPENSKLTNAFSKKSSPPVPAKPRRGSCKIEEKLSELEQIKKKSMSTNDLTENTKRPLSVPKVDILKRREMFEKSQDDESNAVKNRLSGDFSSSKSIRDRVSSFGKISEDVQSIKKVNRMSGEISVKSRLQNIEKQNSLEKSLSKSNLSLNESATSTPAALVKDRLSIKKNNSIEPKETNKSTQVIEEKVIVQDNSPKRLSSAEKRFDTETENSATIKNNDTDKCVDKQPEPDHVTMKEDIHIDDDVRESTTMSPTEDLYESKRQQHYRHRSLDSLDVDSTDGVGNESFERVQSLEDLDFCRNYPASSVSGDTDREDSGIHTADVSSSVSQADDCDLHLDGEFQQQPTILEEINKNPELTSCFIVKQMNQINVSDLLIELPDEVVPGLEVEDNSSSFLKLPLRLDCDPLPVILESPSEPFPTTPELLKTSPYQITSDSSLIPSQSDSTFSFQSEFNSDKSETVVHNDSESQTELCNTNITAFGGDNSLPNTLNVEQALSTLPVQISSAEILHDNNLGAVEISQTIDLSGVTSPLPNHTPSVSVQAEYKFEPTEKLGDRMERDREIEIEREMEGKGGLSELALEISQHEPARPILPALPLINDAKMIESMDVVFPLSPSTLEPPKEKPPPPPTEISDDDDDKNTKPVSLRRLDSTKRIKKEIRQKRSSFLGIEGTNDDNYLEPELELVRRPPDISSFLAEEKRLEQLLYRQSVCSESESRDSGVELEKHQDDLSWPPALHSRDNSETYANTSTTSEEEEIVKKEREIIEMLEREEINRYSTGQDQENIGEKLAERLRELEAEKARLEWERRTEEAARAEQQIRIQARERELSKQESTDVQEQDQTSDMLLAERERLQAEQASLARQRDAILQQQYNGNLNHNGPAPKPYNHISETDHSYELNQNHNRSLTDVRISEPLEFRRSMQDLRYPPARRPPPPIPPSKPLIIPRSQSQERMSSPHQMSRQTLQALSAAPKPRLSDSWLQSKRKPNNYQHWLVQEAEHRRITEHHQRQAPLPRRPVPPPPQAVNYNRASASAGQYANWQPKDKPLPDAIIQSLTQRVQNRLQAHAADPNNNRRRNEQSPPDQRPKEQTLPSDNQEKMLSVSGKKKCSHCGDELGRGAAMIIESLRLFYHIDCFKCCVCCVQLGDGLMGTDVRVRNNKLHCHNCYSSDDERSLSGQRVII